MRKTFLTLALSSVITSCADKKEAISEVNSAKKAESVDLKKFRSDDNATLKNWVSYYKTIDPEFSLDKFEFESEISFDKTAGNIYGIYDKEFDKILSDFIIYSPNRRKYIDMDSYHWSLNEKGELGFEVDQEVNLIDIPTKKIEKIAFYGSSNWVEDAYWKDEINIVLLENGYDQRPTIRLNNINSMKRLTFKYKDSLKNISDYSKHRILSKLKK